jgi:hypothetical protein
MRQHLKPYYPTCNNSIALYSYLIIYAYVNHTGSRLAKYRLCIDSFSALYRPDDDLHSVETCSLVDYFNTVYKLCLTVI